MLKLTFFILLFAFTHVFADAPKNFSKAKKILAEIYTDRQQTFYCGCDYKKINKKLKPNLKSCGYKPRKEQRRANRVEWEHVVPAWAFGHQLQCWQKGGRKNCRKTSKKFKQMEADLVNLVPAIGEVNGNRSNYSFAMLEGEPRVYGQCDFEVDFKAKKVEPAPHVRGDIARIYFYMEKKYGLKISKKQKKLFMTWDKQDPKNKWEIERIKRISMISK